MRFLYFYFVCFVAVTATAQILPPPSPFPPLVRTFTVTAYSLDGMESAHSEPLTTTLRFPLTLSWDASPSADAAGYLVYMTSLNRTRVYDAGTNTSITIAPTNQPSPPLNLRLLIPEQSVQLGPPTEPQRYFRSAVLTSTNINGTNWQIFRELETQMVRDKEP